MAIIPKKVPWTRKPALPKINRSHWFGRHIQSSLLPNLNIREFDVARNKKWTLEGTPVFTNDLFEADSTADNATQVLPFTEWNEATFFVRFKVNTWSNGARIFRTTWSGGDDIRFYMGSGSGFIVAWDDTTFTNQTFSNGQAGLEFIAIMSHDGATQKTWVYNVVTKTLYSASNSDSFTFSGTDGTTDIGINSPDTDFRYAHIANKAVTSTAQALDLIHNEYHLLQPQTRYLFTAAGAAPPGGFLAVWARQQSRILGAR